MVYIIYKFKSLKGDLITNKKEMELFYKIKRTGLFLILIIFAFLGCINKANYLPSLEIAKIPTCLIDPYKFSESYMFANNSDTFIAEFFAGPLGVMVSGIKQVWNTTTLALGLVAVEINDHWINRCSNLGVALLPESGDKEFFVVDVKGSPIIENHIQDGDVVIVERRKEAKNGELILALLDHENLILKRFYNESDQIRLQPISSGVEPIFIEKDNLKVHGVVVGIMRKFN